MPSTFAQESTEEWSWVPTEAVCECPEACRLDHDND
jgi:hypothetical protein